MSSTTPHEKRLNPNVRYVGHDCVVYKGDDTDSFVMRMLSNLILRVQKLEEEVANLRFYTARKQVAASSSPNRRKGE